MLSILKVTERFREENLLLPIWFDGNAINIIDQTRLPFAEEIIVLDEVSQLAEAIRKMIIRGSGAIGISGAYGVYLAALKSKGNLAEVQKAAELLKSTRPTAVNLMKTIDEVISAACGEGQELIQLIEEKVGEILLRQLDFEHRLGEHGSSLIEDGDSILTHCHSGALAGSGYGGRALSVIRKASESGKNIHVYVSETRPYLQGARITCYELEKFNIPYTLITDNMSGFCMSQGKIQKVVVGSDRVAANGDLANKVGTFMHALAAKEHIIPFYTATSSHTIDFNIPYGQSIEVEMRDGKEVTHLNGQRITGEGTKAIYPSFDITPNEYISGIITEMGVIHAPYKKNLDILNRSRIHQSLR